MKKFLNILYCEIFLFSGEKPNFEVPLVAANLAQAEPTSFNGLGQNWNRKEEDSMEVNSVPLPRKQPSKKLSTEFLFFDFEA